jgi:predicted Zn-dependent protease
VANFADAMSRIVMNGSSMGAMEVTLDEIHNHLHARLVSSMDMFIIAHEDAHVILKHVSNQSVEFRLAGGRAKNKRTLAPGIGPQKPNSKEISRQSRNQARDTSVTLMVQVRSRSQELEADALGFKLMMWSEQNSDDLIGQMVAAAAPHMVFSIMDAVDTYGREAGGWGFADGNHPPAADRLKALLPVFDELARDNEVLHQADFRTPLDAALKVLLTEADPQIRQKLDLPAR